MITTLSGSNAFLLQAELRKRVAAFVQEHSDLALERVDGEEAEFSRIQEAVTSLPFLASKKLVVLRAPGANKAFAEGAEQLLAAVPDTTEVIIVEPKLDKRSSYYKFLKKSTEYTEFTEMDANGLAAWLVRTAKEKGGTISSSDARFLIDRVGPNQQLLAGELEKLLIAELRISRQNIEQFTEATPQSTIFQLLEAAFAGNAKRTFELYREQRALKVEPQQIVAMLAWQLHILALIKAAGQGTSTADIAKDAKLSPYVVQKSAGIARFLSLARLRSLIDGLLSIDARSKRTALDVDEALQTYLLKLTQ